MIGQKEIRQLEVMKRLKGAVKAFGERAPQYEANQAFPFENIEDLKEIGYTKLTLPKEYGGYGEGLQAFLYGQELIASVCGSTSLAIGWHNMTILEVLENQQWDPAKKDAFFHAIAKGALVNRAASEPATGSPTRGGRPQTTAVKTGDGWVLNGRKTFTSLAPALDIFLVSAWIPEEETVGWFMVHKDLAGVSIDETWDLIAMEGTGSHDLVLQNVHVKADDYVEKAAPKKGTGWLLHIPACYIGIALGARNYAVQFAKSYTPNSLQKPISSLPHIQDKIGHIELELMQARHFLYAVAARWDEKPNERDEMAGELAAVKYAVTNAAISIVDKAMRVVGAQSLKKSNPMQRYFRDVRAGLHNPPMDDAVLALLANQILQDDEEKAE